MKTYFRWTAAAALVAALAFGVFGSVSHDGAQAQGPDLVDWDIRINDGSTPAGAVGSAVGTSIDLGIDRSGTPPNSAGFFDVTRTTNSGIAAQLGPNMSGGLPASAIGAKTGAIDFVLHTNNIAALIPNGNLAASGSPHAGYVPICGDQDADGVPLTRNYDGTGVPALNAMVVADPPQPLAIFSGNMAQEDAGLRPSGLFASSTPAFVGAEYGTEAAPGNPDVLFVQTYDDDNNNGTPDSQEGAPANEPADGGGNADPYATGGGDTSYLAGAVQTQHDYDHDGIPNALEYMPDYLPLLADALGLAPYWVSRTHGIADVISGVIAPTDVHFMAFAGVPGVGGITFTSLANPFSPANPAGQAGSTCTPFSTSVVLDATSSDPNFGCGSCGTIDVTDGNAVQRVVSSGLSSIDIFVSDQDDYDNDGIVGVADLCETDGSTNADPDGDLTAGSCDANPNSQDNDGDGNAASSDRAMPLASLVAGTASCQTSGNGICDNDVDGDMWINNVDNCPLLANNAQLDEDGDGVGDDCDAFVTTDTITTLPAGKGDGNSDPAAFDNDLICSDPYDSAAVENFGDGVAAGNCGDIVDSNDDGIADADSIGSDEDGDGASDALEDFFGTNTYDPNDTPANPNADDDGDGFTNGCESVRGSDPGNGGSVPAITDTDKDCVTDALETAVGTDPNVAGPYAYDGVTDTDSDGCVDADEVSSTTASGGNRHPGDYWDIFDLNATTLGVDFSDVLGILGQFGQAPDNPTRQQMDRKVAAGAPFAHNLVEGDNLIDFTDVLNALGQFGNGCSSQPAFPPPGAGGGIIG